MKYFVIGLHSSGKQEVIDILNKLGIKCGKIFSDIDKPTEEIYNSYNYELYTSKDVTDVFENNAYVFIQELINTVNTNSYKFFEGLSKYTFDNNNVFVLSPDQFLAIPHNVIDENVCFIWMDGTLNNRRNRYFNEKRSYDFSNRDLVEKADMSSFVKNLYNFNNSPVLYFTDEEPCRVAAIIYSLVKYPELLKVYEKNFN